MNPVAGKHLEMWWDGAMRITTFAEREAVAAEISWIFGDRPWVGAESSGCCLASLVQHTMREGNSP